MAHPQRSAHCPRLVDRGIALDMLAARMGLACAGDKRALAMALQALLQAEHGSGDEAAPVAAS